MQFPYVSIEPIDVYGSKVVVNGGNQQYMKILISLPKLSTVA